MGDDDDSGYDRMCMMMMMMIALCLICDNGEPSVCVESGRVGGW